MNTELLTGSLKNMNEYRVGARDERIWGWYEVIGTGRELQDEFCEKHIGIHPFQALSLQRHQGRREIWTVLSGTLTVIVNGELYTLEKNQSINIPKSAPHCMINASNEQVTVYEKQIGVCREDDNDRLRDMNGRATLPIDTSDTLALKSAQLYERVVSDLPEKAEQWKALIPKASNDPCTAVKSNAS